MCKNEQTIHYCTILSAGQWDFLLDGKAAIDRQKCLYRLMTAAVRTKTTFRIKGVEIELQVHTLHFLTGWYVDGVLLTNPHYVKPAAVSKGQADGVRTPYSNDMPLEDKPCTVPDGCQCPRQEADSMAGRAAALSSSLCSPVVSDRSDDRADAEDETDNSHAGDNGNGQHGNDPVESLKEAQDGTNGGVEDPDIAGRN